MRLPFQDIIEAIELHIIKHGINNGEFNYLISTIAKLYIDKHGMTYNTGSDVIKTFECAKLEFYRRMLVPYENTKIEQNGDCY